MQLSMLVVIVVAVVLIVPPLLGKVAAHGPTEEIVFQFDNGAALHNGEPTRLSEAGGAAPYQENGVAMIPVTWFADLAGLTATWDQASKTIVLADEDREARLTVDHTDMLLDGEAVALEAAPVLKDGVTYIPASAANAAFGWNVSNPQEASSYIFLDNGREPSELTEQQIAEAREQLGPSREELLSGGLIGRVGSGTVLYHGAEVELETEDSKYLGALDMDGVSYLPVETALAAMGGSAVPDADGGFTLTLGDRTASIAEGKIDGKAADANLVCKLYTDESSVVYASCEMLAASLGLQYTSLPDAVFAMTVPQLDGYADQMAYIAQIGAALPDKRPDIPDAKGYIALTFDDGPTGGADGLTVQLLDGLKERGVHATFFMCGYRIKDFHTHMDRYLAEGHELGNHTMDHPLKFSKLSPEEIYNQVDSNSTLIESYTGQRATSMRPVGGAVTDNVKEQMKKLGIPIINWSVDTLDWKYRDAARIRKVIVNEAKDGDIVLMHDLHQPTVDGVLAAIDDLQKEGYAFVTVHELAQIKGVTLEPGVVYTDIKG